MPARSMRMSQRGERRRLPAPLHHSQLQSLSLMTFFSFLNSKPAYTRLRDGAMMGCRYQLCDSIAYRFRPVFRCSFLEILEIIAALCVARLWCHGRWAGLPNQLPVFAPGAWGFPGRIGLRSNSQPEGRGPGYRGRNDPSGSVKPEPREATAPTTSPVASRTFFRRLQAIAAGQAWTSGTAVAPKTIRSAPFFVRVKPAGATCTSVNP